ncbi:hypothetical protein QFC21_006593 [Naganishia friedmannii]|uniref:Uncharacterized protein n=1 Tax=Naganishia friedmannii TaxID=89922 RepID=A0ACC2V183_9TREE|nr:hypothetical protein QFC21_006593 [Naganishia friedmannii]
MTSTITQFPPPESTESPTKFDSNSAPFMTRSEVLGRHRFSRFLMISQKISLGTGDAVVKVRREGPVRNYQETILNDGGEVGVGSITRGNQIYEVIASYTAEISNHMFETSKQYHNLLKVGYYTVTEEVPPRVPVIDSARTYNQQLGY